MAECNHCNEVLETPLACGSCESIFPVDGQLSPFEVFGMPLSAHVDRSALRKRLLAMQRLLHPDFHGAAGDQQQGVAEHNTAELNAAFELLRDASKRASWLVQYLGGPSESEERQMAQAFLMEVMEWNETLEEARAGAERDPVGTTKQLEEFRAKLNIERAELLEATLDGLEPLIASRSGTADELLALRRYLNAIRYIDRALTELASISQIAHEAAQAR